jgi:hypothetical protein
MGITSKDIAAQRAMLARGEEKRLRDQFAASALTGLTSRPQWMPDECVPEAYRLADAMLHERAKRQAISATEKAMRDAEDFVAIREQFLAWQKEQSVGVAEMDSASDRKSVATPRACARSCSQPFDSAPTTHDAAPEAIARDADRVRTDKATTRPGEGTGNTHKPVAWARFFSSGGPQSVYLDRPPADAEPLYRSPTLTDGEREAVKWAVETSSYYAGAGHRQAKEVAATLRNLLERLK